MTVSKVLIISRNHLTVPLSLSLQLYQVRQAIKFQYTDWAAEASEASAASARFGKAADVAADSQFVCPMEDVIGTLSSGDDDDAEGVHIFRSQNSQ